MLVVGVLNILYGIGALDEANNFVGDTRFILTDLNASSAQSARCFRSAAYPRWSLGICVLCVWVVYGILVFGEEQRAG